MQDFDQDLTDEKAEYDGTENSFTNKAFSLGSCGSNEVDDSILYGVQFTHL